jgi:hypothetical protein
MKRAPRSLSEAPLYQDHSYKDRQARTLVTHIFSIYSALVHVLNTGELDGITAISSSGNWRNPAAVRIFGAMKTYGEFNK